MVLGGSSAHAEPGRIRVDVPEGALRTFREQNAVRELSLFVSVLREDFTPDSDIDVLLDRLTTRPLTFAVPAHMEDDLERIFHRRVNLVLTHTLSWYIAADVLRQRRVLYVETQ